jgi:peptide deformylase
MNQMKLLISIIALLAPAAESLLNYQKLNVNNQRHASNSNSNYRYNNNNLQMRLNPTSFTGTDYTITEFPRPALRRVPNAPIAVFDDRFQAKTQEMFGIMYQAKGVGLAAPQIGLNENIFVYNPSGPEASSNPNSKNMERVVCNPTITKYSPEVDVEKEGCLSLRSDDCAGQVARSVWIETAYQNELGQKVRRRLKGFEARVFQHEYDHLKGILCYDRFPPEDREAVQKSIEFLLGLYTDDDAQVEPDLEEEKVMQPRPLSAKRMPPLELETGAGDADADAEDVPTRKKAAKPVKSGFGAGGGMGKKTGKKTEKKKKVKVRNGAFSNNPTFK